MQKRLVIGILAHVDAGKTTLSESILYTSGKIKKLGRVDKKDAFLDNYTLERERGITIFSKQAVFEYGGVSFTLVDTPGHVDFSAETERTLSVLDAAILVISGPEGVQAHTRTLWRLLKNYDIPVFIFVNKTDRDVNRTLVLENIKRELSGVCVDMSGIDDSRRGQILEEIAMCREDVMDEFLTTGNIYDEMIIDLVGTRELFPTCFGSALKCEGVDKLLGLLSRFCPVGYENDEKNAQKNGKFSARVFKIGRDSDQNRLTFMKITGGSVANREVVEYFSDSVQNDTEDNKSESSKNSQTTASVPQAARMNAKENGCKLTEKITQLRVYSGEKYEAVDRAEQGMIVAVLGLTATYPGQAIGEEDNEYLPELIPVMTYRVVENDPIKLRSILQKLKLLEEEEPTLHVYWDEELKELCIRIMGEIQLEIVKYQLLERFGEKIEFDKGSVLYKETVGAPVIGVGHFEPLRHYAEVQLLIEPAPEGSGISSASACSTNDLELNWQRLINTHIYEKEHKGVLTGAALTDVKITIVAGRAHLKHTEGGDFRQATYRAIRQGLMKAENVLLEPWYDFTLYVPQGMVGRAMTDVERMSGRFTSDPELSGEMMILRGKAPVSEMQGYIKDVSAYTKGLGTLSLSHGGYMPCHNAAEVIAAKGYDPEADLKNPSSSVFCAHGAGFAVPWDEVDRYKHISCELDLSGSQKRIIRKDNDNDPYISENDNRTSGTEERWMGVDEVDAIIERTAYSNRKISIKNPYRKHRKKDIFDTLPGNSGSGALDQSGKSQKKNGKTTEKEKYLLVDGYNIIFAWDELKSLADRTLDGAREALNEILSNYRARKNTELIVVYDAYRVAGHPEEFFKYHNITVVYTKEAETADKFIERFAHTKAAMYDITVATSDGLEQIIIRGAGCKLMTARDLHEDVERDRKVLRDQYMSAPFASAGTLIGDVLKKQDTEKKED
ncbi:MAG: TetM/TetW/TetO/TetS family tetracycline resistance ribosomal protection protein [Lachnospiraceae bacterium]|nr:TetM/TetW/TetO/TetS family tetracycline resistance ribosomal protection protein [Lachnospiraceae bacterium]